MWQQLFSLFTITDQKKARENDLFIFPMKEQKISTKLRCFYFNKSLKEFFFLKKKDQTQLGKH